MKLQRILSVTVTIVTVLSVGTVAAFAQTESEEMAACAAAASFGLVPALAATLLVPSAILFARQRRRNRR